MTATGETVLGLLESLANNDDSIIGKTVRSLVKQHGYLYLPQLEQQIMEKADPAFRATVNAANDFMRAANHTGKLYELPHINTIYNLALDDVTAPKTIFNTAATWLRERSANIESSIRMAVAQYQELPRQEMN